DETQPRRRRHHPPVVPWPPILVEGPLRLQMPVVGAEPGAPDDRHALGVESGAVLEPKPAVMPADKPGVDHHTACPGELSGCGRDYGVAGRLQPGKEQPPERGPDPHRSEERRVGKECRAGWAA